MNIGVIGDLHLGRSLYGYSLSDSIRNSMWEFVSFCKRYSVDTAIQLGDVFDRPIPTEADRKLVAQWCNEFDRAKIPLFILGGNHEAMARESTPFALQYLKAGSQKSNPWIVDRPLVFQPADDCKLDVNLILLPFPSSGIYDSATEYNEDVEHALRRLDGSYTSVCFSHLNVTGASLGNQEFVYRGADYVLPDCITCTTIAGHIHTPQTIGNRIEVIGAADRLRFDEAGQPRYFGLVTTTKDAVHVTRYVRTTALNLLELVVDASGSNRLNRAKTTDEVIEELANHESRCCFQWSVVKVVPYVDRYSVVDWSEVRNWLYSDGARFVQIAPPILVEHEKKVRMRRKRKVISATDPEQAALMFLRSKVSSKSERVALFNLFGKALRQLDNDR